MRLLILLLALATPAAAQRPYHLELQANPAAPFPYLGKFGTVDLHVYSGGVYADSVWLNGFSRNGSKNVTVVNPIGRMYVDVPIAQIAKTLTNLAGDDAGIEKVAVATMGPKAQGKVKGIDATRYRLLYSDVAWIDVWTTKTIPENPQLTSIVNEFVRGISPGTFDVAKDIEGTPIYVELNFRRFKKVPILTLKKLSFDTKGQEDALTLGKVYMRAPLLEKLWK